VLIDYLVQQLQTSEQLGIGLSQKRTKRRVAA